jgi:putative phosphoesterase
MRVGVLSDTHGLLRPRVLELLTGCELILHAGDVGGPQILAALSRLAPVLAVRGNVDDAESGLPLTRTGEFLDRRFQMVHRPEDIGSAWLKEFQLIVFGHTHRPELRWHGDCLLLNPGACGPQRFRYPLTLAILEVEERRITPQILAVS